MVDETLYPEATANGGLGPALVDAARQLGIDIGEVVPAEPADYGFFAVTVSYGQRKVAVDVGAVRRVFHINASAGENIWSAGATADLAEVVRVADTWRQGVSLRELHGRFPFMTYKPLAEGFERGNPTEVQWAEVLADPHLDAVHPLLRAVQDDPQLGHLFPAVTHHTLVRLLRDPADWGAGQLYIELTRHGYMVGSSWDEEYRAAATVEEAIEAAAALLPGYRPGVDGRDRLPWWE